MKGRRSALPLLPALRALTAGALALGAGQTAALTLEGQLRGDALAGLSVGVWSVGPAGQPQQLLGAAPAPQGRWSLTLTLSDVPSSPVHLQGTAPGWPGLLPPVRMSGDVRAQEVRAYTFVDQDRDGRPDAGTVPHELRLRDGERTLFLVWTDGEVQVGGAHGYQAELGRGWNALGLQLTGGRAELRPYSGGLLDAR